MLVEIIKVDGDKITVTKDKVEKTYEMEDFVVTHAKKCFADISFNDDSKKVRFIRMEPTEDPYKDDSKDKKEKKKTGKWEDDMVTFEDLLTATHKKSGGNFSIKTEMLAIDLKEKYALFKATVSTSGKDGNVSLSEFDGHGDATQENVKGDHIKPHFIRMAETRAIVRALRWYTNNGCAEEEK